MGGRMSPEAVEIHARFSGALSAGTNYVTGQIGTPIDSFRFTRRIPITTNGYVRMGIAAQLQTVEEVFA